MTGMILSNGLNLEEWWQINAQSIEWLYVLQKLKDSVVPKPGDTHCLLGEGPDGSQTYLLKKLYYTPEAISKVTGLAVAALQSNSGLITLKPNKAEAPKKSTVNYWGEA